MMTGLDWGIVALFAALLVGIAVATNKMTKSVAGFLSSERLAGRYLLTIAQSMAFLSAIGTVGQAAGHISLGERAQRFAGRHHDNPLWGMWHGFALAGVQCAVRVKGNEGKRRDIREVFEES